MQYPKQNPPPYVMGPPPGAPPQMMPPPQIIVGCPMSFGPDPQPLVCPSCHTNICTSVRKENTTKTHLFAVLLCFIFFPLACFPYCMDSCQSSNHYCPRCGAYLGAYNN